MKLVEAAEPNCRAYAFYKMGILPRETFVERDVLDGFPLIQVDLEEAVAIGALMEINGKMELVHIAVFDEQDKSLVWHRPDTGKDIICENVDDVFQRYDGDVWPPCEVIYLKRA